MLPTILFISVASLQATDMLVEKPDDAAISSRVKTALLQHLSLNFCVITNAGVVTLSGTAVDNAERESNQKLAAEINGVKGVVNKMVIPATVARNN